MKKIYILFFITILGSTVFAQVQVRNEKNVTLNLHPAENNVLSVKHSSNNTSSKGGTISSVEVGYVDAIYATYGGTAVFNTFVEPIFPDTLMKINDGGSNRFYGSAGFGQVLDMTSGVFGSDLGIYNAQFKSTESYTVDSIGIPYTYTKINPEIDTLIVTISVSTPYTDPFNPNYSISYASDGTTNLWTLLTSPLEYYGSTADGYHSGLLGSNKTVIKVPLTTAETVGSLHYVPTNMTVGAGKIFSVFVEYKPAYTYTNGDLAFVYSSGTGTPVVSSLIATLVVDKQSPAYRYFVDMTGDPGLTTNFSSFLPMNARYATNSNFRDSIVSPVPTAGIPFTYFISGNSTVDINENSSLNNFTVYPNPSTGSFNVSLVNANEFNMTVVDVLGNIVINKTVIGNNATVDLSNKQTGIYFVKVTSDNFVSTKRLVVTK